MANELNRDLNNNIQIAEYNYANRGIVRFAQFFPKKSKNVIDNIDKSLAKQYGFTEEELDFIINYDIKYRMGDELNEEQMKNGGMLPFGIAFMHQRLKKQQKDLEVSKRVRIFAAEKFPLYDKYLGQL